MCSCFIHTPKTLIYYRISHTEHGTNHNKHLQGNCKDEGIKFIKVKAVSQDISQEHITVHSDGQNLRSQNTTGFKKLCHTDPSRLLHTSQAALVISHIFPSWKQRSQMSSHWKLHILIPMPTFSGQLASAPPVTFVKNIITHMDTCAMIPHTSYILCFTWKRPRQ